MLFKMAVLVPLEHQLEILVCPTAWRLFRSRLHLTSTCIDVGDVRAADAGLNFVGDSCMVYLARQIGEPWLV